MARNVPRVKVDPPKMNEYLGLRKSTITRVYTVYISEIYILYYRNFICCKISCLFTNNIYLSIFVCLP